YYKNRPLLPAKLRYIKKWINKILDKGFIYKLTLLAAVLLLLAIKPNRTIRLYIDYYGLNKIIIKNCYLLLLVSKILDKLFRAKIFIKLNL
ncbi:uncharacterized protein K441DRAFT_577943, partial [Cenococcum geophilum 1.58]|uniref:uncharacterized protein n=1 Tax=Cenococcum geophilum 1.58 TaxID=794803 RepID=UPI00358F8888